jgi:DNA-binding MarR family transcriptional regulator
MTTGKVRFDSLGDMLGFQLRRASASLMRALEIELEPLGLRTSEATLLICLGENPGRTQGEIGAELRIKPANMVPTVSRLAAAGLIARVPGARRSIALYLTDDGARRLEAVRGVIQRQEEQMTGQMSAADRERVLGALKTIAEWACHAVKDKDRLG